jgi:hypothetical protein
MNHLATVVSTWDIVEPLLELGFGTLLAIVALILIRRSRRSWLTLGISVVCVGTSLYLFRHFLLEREQVAEVNRRINTESQLISLNSLLVSIQIFDSESKRLGDADLIRRMRADDRIKGMLPGIRESDNVTDFWSRNLFIAKDASGYRILRSRGPDGRAATNDDL